MLLFSVISSHLCAVSILHVFACADCLQDGRSYISQHEPDYKQLLLSGCRIAVSGRTHASVLPDCLCPGDHQCHNVLFSAFPDTTETGRQR